MNCPRCSSEIDERQVSTGRAGVCSSCRGAWVPFASIEVVMPRLGELAPVHLPGQAVQQPPGALPVQSVAVDVLVQRIILQGGPEVSEPVEEPPELAHPLGDASTQLRARSLFQGRL